MKTLILRVDLQIPEHQEREFFVDKFQTFFDSYHPSLRAAVAKPSAPAPPPLLAMPCRAIS